MRLTRGHRPTPQPPRTTPGTPPPGPAGASSTNPVTWCGASAYTGLTNPVGPCVLRAGHDGPVHQDANGATWWPTPDPDSVDQAINVLANEIARQAVEGDGTGSMLGVLHTTVVGVAGGPSCTCGAQRFAGRTIHNTGCWWANSHEPLRALAARALTEQDS